MALILTDKPPSLHTSSRSREDYDTQYYHMNFAISTLSLLNSVLTHQQLVQPDATRS